MRITFVPFGALQLLPDGRRTSAVASARYRVLIPARQLEALGHAVTLLPIDSERPPQNAEAAMEADAVIFMKSYFRIDDRLARLAKENGACVVLDMCDNHFEHLRVGARCQAMASLADRITCATPALAEVCREYTATPCTVISDPYEGPAGTPCFAPAAGHLKLLWFGHSSNLPTLLPCIPDLTRIAQEIPVRLHLMSETVDGMKKLTGILNTTLPERLSASLTAWSTQALWDALKATDLVIIPTTDGPATRTKSPNRMVEALRAGRMVVAHPLPAYLPFGEWAWVGERLTDGIRWALEHRDAVPPRIAAAQRHIEDFFSPEVVGNQWAAMLDEVKQQPRKLRHAG